MAAAAVIPQSPSPFAALLRRSKFASFDPSIGQVYTTTGGDAHRGNYGLKRALALRKRNAFVRFTAVDSRHQQTEWSTGQKEAKWLAKFTEAGRRPAVAYGSSMHSMSGPYGERPWEVDTDFALGAGQQPVAEDGAGKKKNMPAANIASMSPRQFERHLERLRSLRPAFAEFLATTAKEEAANGKAKPHVRSTNLLEQAQIESPLHKMFLSQEAYDSLHKSESTEIEQQLHPNGALSYTHTPDLQHFLLKKPLDGRAVDMINPGDKKSAAAVFAGMTADIATKRSEAVDPMDWKPLVEQGIDTAKGFTKFRMTNAQLARAPLVVGRYPEGLEGMRLKTSVSSHSKPEMQRANSYPPWSREYNAHISTDVAAVDVKRMTSMARTQKKQAKFGTSPLGKISTTELMGTLQRMVAKSNQS